MPDLSLPKYNLNISTPAPIIGTSGITYQPGKYTKLTNPDLGNPFQKNPFGKTDSSLKKPSEMKLDRPKTEKSETSTSSKVFDKKTIYFVTAAVFTIAAIVLIKNNNEN